MLPFQHIYGYTLFPGAYEVSSKWIGFVRIHDGTGKVQCQPTADHYDTEHAASVAAAIDAAGIANAIRAMG